VSPATWQALLDGALAERAGAVVGSIVERMTIAPPTTAGLGDAAGRALLFARVDRDDEAEAQLDVAMSSSELHGPGLFGGLAGVAFVLAQLGCEVDGSVDDGLGAMVESMSRHDLVFGVAGVGVYALERMPATASLLERVIAWLEAHATRATPGRFLFSAPDALGAATREQFPQGAIDLGVAHGQGGVIAVAGAAAAWGVAGARALYEDLVAYVWSQASDRAPFFRSMVGSSAGRAAWCYGDPGVAAALFAAANAAGDHDTRRRALDVARAAARRVALDDVAEAHFCHGAIGLAHVWNRLAQAAADDELAAAARAWYDRALRLPVPGELGLLEGQLGVALALCSATSDREPTWDRALAVSLSRPD